MEKKDDNSSQPPVKHFKHEICLLTVEQVKQLLNTAQEYPMKALVTVALTLGLRRSEIAGLHWQDLDVEDKILHVRRIVSPTGKRATTEVARSIALPRITLGVLKEQRSRQEEAHAKAGEAWQDLGLIFPDERGQYLDPSQLWRRFYALFAAAGLPNLHFHDLRRNTAALLLAMGANGHVVQGILGYRWRSRTLSILAPVSLSMQRDVMHKWDELLGEQEITPRQSNEQANHVKNQE